MVGADGALPGRVDDRPGHTIVNVALPSIREDLQFTETALVWVVNAYMLTFGGFLLLGGRLGDCGLRACSWPA